MKTKPKTAQCRKCKAHVPVRQFARNASRTQTLYLCRLCVAEQAKLSYREKRFPGYVERLKTWPSIKLLSEQAWLLAQLEAIENELDRLLIKSSKS